MVKMMKRQILRAAVLAAVFFASFNLQAHEPVALDQVPAAVMKSLKTRLPGFIAAKAMYEMQDNDKIYTVEGRAGDKEYAVIVASKGVILEVYDKDYYEKNIED